MPDVAQSSFIKRFVAVSFSFCFVASTTAGKACAADYPERAIRAIVPFATGSTTDFSARLVSPYLSKTFGQSVVVENRAGAAAAIGMEAVAKSTPDGYTILYNASAATQMPALARNLRFDPLNDLQPVATISEASWAFMINAHLPVKNLVELIKLAQRNPGRLNASSGGVGSRLAIELFKIKAKTNVEIISYNGNGPSSIAIATGESDFGIADASSMLAYISSGRVRMLAVAGENRLSSFPNVPTTGEAGLPGYTASSTTAIYVAAKTPASIVQKLNAAVNKIIVVPEVSEQINKLGGNPSVMSVEQINHWYRRELQLWKDIVVRARIPTLD